MEKNNLSFEDLPSVMAEVLNKVTNIEQQLTTSNAEQKNQDKWFSIDDICEYLPGKPAKATIYGKVHRREIPHQKSGKRLSFLKSEIDLWLKSQSRELADSAKPDGADYLINKKGHHK